MADVVALDPRRAVAPDDSRVAPLAVGTPVFVPRRAGDDRRGGAGVVVGIEKVVRETPYDKLFGFQHFS